MQRNYIENNKDLTIFTIDNFISDEDCNYLCDLIEKNNYRSLVTGEGNQYSVANDNRTSSTSTLENTDSIVKKINENIANELQVPTKNGETLQGQLYEIGQEFKHHHDYFSGDGYINHCLASGQRTWTCMAYLNDVEEGGETDFPQIEVKFKPKKGMAVFWSHFDSNGKENPASLHAGTPVIKGKKIIITKWFRKNEWIAGADSQAAQKHHDNLKQQQLESKTFKNPLELPKLTPLGFKVVKVPADTWQLIQESYGLLKNVIRQENWEGIKNIIHDKDGNAPVEIMSMDNCPRIRQIIHNELKPIHEEFSGENLEPTYIYGIRSYKRGAILESHKDRIATHHISAIIIVDKQVDRDWPLDIQDHEGNWHKIYAEVGDMILYESAICEHGRKEPLEGEYFRNFFVHYKLKDWVYNG
jgi:prolyl 4-hydroxylase